MIICEICGKEKIYYSKNKCKTCYHRTKWRADQEAKKQNPEEYKKYKDRRNLLAQKRFGKLPDVVIEYKIKRSGEGCIDNYGYKRITIPDHPNATKRGYVREHILVMS